MKRNHSYLKISKYFKYLLIMITRMVKEDRICCKSKTIKTIKKKTNINDKPIAIVQLVREIPSFL